MGSNPTPSAIHDRGGPKQGWNRRETPPESDKNISESDENTATERAQRSGLVSWARVKRQGGSCATTAT